MNGRQERIWMATYRGYIGLVTFSALMFVSMIVYAVMTYDGWANLTFGGRLWRFVVQTLLIALGCKVIGWIYRWPQMVRYNIAIVRRKLRQRAAADPSEDGYSEIPRIAVPDKFWPVLITVAVWFSMLYIPTMLDDVTEFGSIVTHTLATMTGIDESAFCAMAGRCSDVIVTAGACVMLAVPLLLAVIAIVGVVAWILVQVLYPSAE